MEMEKDLQALADELTKQIQANPVSCMLMEPLSLTVKKRDGQYSKRPHVGGENFRPESVYAGKRGKMIYVFKPQDVADYVTMEMDENMAKKSLSDFGDYIARVAGPEFARSKKEAMEAASMAAEREKLSERIDQYADLGFGSW